MQFLRIKRALLCGALVAWAGAAILKSSRAKNNSIEAVKAPQSTLEAPNAAPTVFEPLQSEYRGQALLPGAQDYPPAVAREFRAAWVATVYNMDWPSKSGLSAGQQQAEVIAILDRAVALKLNALIWQVRPACDAFYRSELEPWSGYLSGEIGVDPGYDPLQFIVEAAHARGIELHAWFNPYRAGSSAKTDYPASHISKTHPDWVKLYGKYLWLDPGMPAVADYSLQVIRDVTRRYDIDGIHFDDYFYPYREKDAAGQLIPFPDDESYQKYFDGGGTLSRDDWRRDNVNRLVERVGKAVHEEKPDVKFGISPFGIWRPGHPSTIKGMDSFTEIYADSRLWLQSGWVDYFVPQLYWSIDNPPQSYPVLLNWWSEQNTQNRHLWPGHGAHRVVAQAKITTGNVTAKGFAPAEILRQVELTRAQKGAGGDVFFNMTALMSRQSTLGGDVATKLYAEPALVPASPWLDSRAPVAPKLEAHWKRDTRRFALKWRAGNREKVAHWTLQTRVGEQWKAQIFPGAQTQIELEPCEIFALCAVDRAGNQSAPVVVHVR